MKISKKNDNRVTSETSANHVLTFFNGHAFTIVKAAAAAATAGGFDVRICLHFNGFELSSVVGLNCSDG